MKNKLYIGDGLALVAGTFLTLAFAPFEIFPLGILSPALLLGLWLTITPGRAFFRGWLYGLGFFGTGVHWVYISIHTYGNASALLSTFVTIGFINILALFPALVGYFLNRFFPQNNNAKILFAFPALWVLLEWIRSRLMTGFAWLSLGDSQLHSPLKGYAPLVSTYGVSLAAILSSGLIITFVVAFRKHQKKIAYRSLFAFALLWIVGGCLSLISWTTPLNSPLQVSLVQGNIPQEIKWSPEQVQPTLDRYEALSKPHWDSNIVIWPEGAIPTTLQNADWFIQRMSDEAKRHQSTLITGIPIQVADANTYYNTVIATGEGFGIYKKRHLVPFGEYTPLSSIFQRLLGSLNIPMSDFVPGEETLPPIVASGIKIATFICYEIALAEQVVGSDKDTGIILAVSNDAWFGQSIAQAQHLQIAQMRALEMGRPVLFVANTGITAVIGPNGNIQSAAPPYQTYVLTDKVQARSGQTPWQRYGIDPLLIILVGMLFYAGKTRNTLK